MLRRRRRVRPAPAAVVEAQNASRRAQRDAEATVQDDDQPRQHRHLDAARVRSRKNSASGGQDLRPWTRIRPPAAGGTPNPDELHSADLNIAAAVQSTTGQDNAGHPDAPGVHRRMNGASGGQDLRPWTRE
jgi:hypothetical protein